MRVSRVFAVVAVLVATSGCVSTGQVQRFSAAGTSYARSVDQLLVVTRNAGVDADSMRMLSQKTSAPRGASEADRRVARQSRIAVFDNHAGVSETVQTMGRLRQHAKLLGAYFEALNGLATTDAPARAQTAAQGAAAALDQLGTQLGGSTLLTLPEQQAIGQLTGLAVTGVQRGMLAQELRDRADLINRQLLIHEKLTAALAAKLEADRGSLARLGMQREVRTPFVEDAIRSEPKWIEARRRHLLQGSGLEALRDTEAAAGKLRAAWIALVEGRFDELAFQDLLKDVALLASAVQTVRTLD